MANPLRVLIVEDEPAARRRLRRFLVEEGVEVIGEADDGESAVSAILKEDVDVVFLDVEMPGMDGFEVIQSVGVDRMPAVVFVTAFDEYAVEAFKVHAVDYLLKPFDEHRLRQTLDRLPKSLKGSDNGLAELLDDIRRERERLGSLLEDSDQAGMERLLIKEDDSIRFVAVRDIDWIEAEGNYVRVHVGERKHLVRRKIGDLERQLDDRRFVRIHRSTIVNLDAVDKLVPWFSGGYVVRLKSGHEAKLSRGYAAKLFERVGTDF